jgi:hypothetical protein
MCFKYNQNSFYIYIILTNIRLTLSNYM